MRQLRGATYNGKPIDIYVDTFPEKITHVFGFTINRDDKFIISVSDRTPNIRQTLGHELAHVFCDHLNKEKYQEWSRDMEREADRKALRYYALWRMGLLH